MVEQASEPLREQLVEFIRALTGFELVMAYDFSGRNDIELDIYKNACIQKFEYCTELSWKLVKRFLEEIGGDIPSSPKMVYRHLFSNHWADEELATALFLTINDRNRLSHGYRESVFDEVYGRIPGHLVTLKKLATLLQPAIGE